MASRRLISLIVVLTISAISQADSAIFAPAPEYQANDILTSAYFSGYDVCENNIVGWVDDWGSDVHSLKVFDKSGTEISDLGSPAAYTYGWTNFVKLDPSGDSVWVGFSVLGNTDDRIYQVDFATGTWTYSATMAGNFEMEFSGGNRYISGLNSTSWSAPSSIWLLDTSGDNNHDLIASVGGYSAGFAFDSSGNLYYGTNGLSDNALLWYTAGQIAGAVGAGSLSFSDAVRLSDIDGGAYDTDVDDADNILFNGNDGVFSYAAIWNGTTASVTNYDLIGTGNGAWGNWFTFVASQGDVTVGGSLYQADYYFSGIAEVTITESALATMAVRNIKIAIASKAEAQDAINRALVKERAARKALNALAGVGEPEDLKPADIVKARQKIHSAIQHERQSKNTLRKSVNKLEDALEILTGEFGN